MHILNLLLLQQKWWSKNLWRYIERRVRGEGVLKKQKNLKRNFHPVSVDHVASKFLVFLNTVQAYLDPFR